MAAVEYLADFTLLPLFIYLWVSLIRSKDTYLNINFYFLFCSTGFFEIMSAVAHNLLILISFSTEQAWIYTILIAIRHIGEMAATMGKLFIIIDRHQVMTTLKGGNIHEYTGDPPVTMMLLQIGLPFLTALHLCDYLSAAEGLKVMNGESRWFLYQGILNIVVCSTYTVLGIGLFVRACFRMIHLLELMGPNDANDKAIRFFKSMVEVTASVCISHSFKAVYQIVAGVLALLNTFDTIIWIPYMDTLNIVTNGISMYATPFFLVLFSRRVRQSLQREVFKKVLNGCKMLRKKTL